MLPGLEVTMYEVIGEPPFEDGAVNATETCPMPALTLVIAGAPGAPIAVTAADESDAGPVPFRVVAVTVNV
jgi:hypothetical protein